GLFDLVVVDEASHVDQPLAAPALVRAGRAVIAGDPRQLRHVSFVSGDQVRRAVAAEGTGRLSGLLDVPRMSLLDVAVGASPAHWLDEHYRCAPHLISFAISRFYAGRIALLTTHPSIADLDCIHVRHVTGTRNAEGVNEAEVAAVVEHARRLIAEGATSVGLLSPFRAQADAIEKAALAGLSLEQITSGGLRVGTVHSFQGSECDELVVSLALSDRDPAASWRFLNDPNLVTVLTTRARRTVALFTSAAQPTGLIAEYIAHGESPPSETAGTPTNDEWGAELATELRRAGHEVRTGYPVGHWSVDLVVGGGERAIALETRVHQEGVPAHLARWRTLNAAGWRAYDAYPTRFGRDSTTAVIQLGTELDQTAHDQTALDQTALDQTAHDEPALDETARA
ncbi:MAG TPA: DEAD/DEAH box helicase, partial [Pseudonocardiaceae bacterium]|nr:DEAD/DEAH box helicase [Pseudonocardiaceae bacterium]